MPVRADSGQVRQGMAAEEALRALYPPVATNWGGGQRLKGTSKYVLDSYAGTAAELGKGSLNSEKQQKWFWLVGGGLPFLKDSLITYLSD